MTPLLSAFTQSMTPDMVGKLSEALGLDALQVEKGLEVIGPLVLGSLARKSETPSSVDEIVRMVPEDSGSVFARLFGSDDGASTLLSKVLGPGASSIVKTLSARLGFNVTRLVAAAVPALLRAITTAAKEQNVGSGEIATLLETQSAATLESADPQTRAIVDEAFYVSDKAEALKAMFSPSDWRAIRLAPQAVAHYVVTADSSGLTGMAKELLIAGDATADLVTSAQPTSLVDVAFGSVPDEQELDSGTFDPEAPREALLALVQTAAAAVRTKASSEAKAFGDTLVALAQEVAEASKEGGFLGIGGTLVSKEEEQAIADIAGAVDGRVATT